VGQNDEDENVLPTMEVVKLKLGSKTYVLGSYSFRNPEKSRKQYFFAGLSVACAVNKVYPVAKYSKVFAICGPGNNGGDALVAARHLAHFGYQPTVVYPKPTDKPLYKSLVTQCKQVGVPILEHMPTPQSLLEAKVGVILDGVFGFSFKAENAESIRSPFDKVIKTMVQVQKQIPIAAIDIPSGWDVDKGDVLKTGLAPHLLISLTAPKQCARYFQGEHHYLGGRFIPPGIIEAYKLQLPPYPGSEQCVAMPLVVVEKYKESRDK